MHGVTESRPVTVRMEARPWRSGNKTTEWATKLALTRSAFSWKGRSNIRWRIAISRPLTMLLRPYSRILYRDGAFQRLRRRGEGGHEAVAGRLDLAAAVRLQRFARDALVLAKNL